MARKSITNRYNVNGSGEEPEEIEITLVALDGNTSAELGIRLLQIFGPSLLSVATAMESSDMSKVAEAASSAFSKLTPSEFTAIKRQLLRGSQARDGGEFHEVDDRFVAEKFAGRLGSLMLLMSHALKLNFASFFEDLGVSKNTIAKLTARLNPQAPKTSAPAA